MKKKYSKTMMALGATLTGGLLLAGSAVAGPQIDFGENGYLQLDVKFQGILDYTDFGSGQDGEGRRWDAALRRARLVFTGMFDETWGAKFQTCAGTSATRNFGGGGYELAKNNSKTNSQIRLTDGYLIGMFNDMLNIKLGLTKIPLTRANLDECFAPLSHERSSFVYSPYGTDATKNSRDMGLVATGAFVDNHLKYFAGIMEGREGAANFYNPFVDKTFTTSAEPSSNLEYVARVHYSFLDPETSASAGGYKGFYLGKKGKVLTLGVAGAYEADAAYKNTAPAGAPGTPGFFLSKVNGDETVDYTAWTADVFFEYPFANTGVLTATALYLDVDFDDAYLTTSAPADLNTIVGGAIGQRDGYYGKVGYVLPLTVGAKGKIQPFARYENWDIASLLGVRNQTVEQWGVGANYYVKGNDRIRFTLEYSRTNYDKPTDLADYTDQTAPQPHDLTDSYDTMTAMFMVSF
ncbi:MAG: OprO/OprP family phosphate-selective porin [Desulfoarculaceae bacterium]|nr:OprO/OprP family phosphate-selective porin [Desulfoarculaceae bacterium]